MGTIISQGQKVIYLNRRTQQDVKLTKTQLFPSLLQSLNWILILYLHDLKCNQVTRQTKRVLTTLFKNK